PWAKALPELIVPQSMERAAALGHSIEWTEAYAGALYNFQNTLEGVEEGLADLGWVGTLWEPAKMPMQNVSFFAPFVTTDLETLLEIGTAINKDIPEVAAAWEAHNQKLLGIFSTDAYILLTRDPVTKISDLDGLKIYAPGAVSRWLEGTGAVGVDGGLPVYYEGVKNGIADGMIAPTGASLVFKLFEVAPYATVVELGGGISGGLTMNLDTWNTLPPELQSMFEDLGAEYSQYVLQGVGGFYNRVLQIYNDNPDVTLTTLPEAEMQKWADSVPNIAGQWVASNEAKGLPAAQVLQVFMDTVRQNGGAPLRNWDQELSN
ncbi:MAG: C4-dicarboxylate TRAP transporter substrate-binding protein, partial [Alphaproteobacteria bacterium]|nr:C4-dicarboxylate TRAP transporter substrate-binding protein [Alphaproteobacteria bacterium]